MNDKQFERMNHLITFGIITCIIFTAGNVALFHFTLSNQLQEQIFEAEWETANIKMEYSVLEMEYYLLEQTYKSMLFDGSYFNKMYVFKDDYLGESHAAVSIYSSMNDAETIQFALDHAQHIIGRGDFILDQSLNITGDHKVIQDLRLWGGGIDISTRAPWYNESGLWYNPFGDQINKTTGLPINQTKGPQ